MIREDSYSGCSIPISCLGLSSARYIRTYPTLAAHYPKSEAQLYRSSGRALSCQTVDQQHVRYSQAGQSHKHRAHESGIDINVLFDD